jgi:ribosomal protein L19
MFQAKKIQKHAGVVIYIPNKAAIKPKLVRRNKEGHYILINIMIHQEVLTMINT